MIFNEYKNHIEQFRLSSRPCICTSPSHISHLPVIREVQDARAVKQGHHRLCLTDIHGGEDLVDLVQTTILERLPQLGLEAHEEVPPLLERFPYLIDAVLFHFI